MATAGAWRHSWAGMEAIVMPEQSGGRGWIARHVALSQHKGCLLHKNIHDKQAKLVSAGSGALRTYQAPLLLVFIIDYTTSVPQACSTQSTTAAITNALFSAALSDGSIGPHASPATLAAVLGSVRADACSHPDILQRRQYCDQHQWLRWRKRAHTHRREAGLSTQSNTLRHLHRRLEGLAQPQRVNRRRADPWRQRPPAAGAHLRRRPRPARQLPPPAT